MTHLEQIALLKQNGYMVFHMEPVMWRVRGVDGYIDFWPLIMKWRPYGNAPLRDYHDVLVMAQAQLTPWPDEMTEDQKQARCEWEELSTRT